MSMRTCTKCGETKPVSKFYLRDAPDRNQQYFSVCKSCILKHNNEYRAKHRRHRNKIEREAKQRTMLKALQKLSPEGVAKCAVCGFNDDLRLLQIDHKNNNGAKDRTKAGQKRTGAILQAKIIRMSVEDARAEYQVLCIIHNWIKRFGITGEEYSIIKRGKPTPSQAI